MYLGDSNFFFSNFYMEVIHVVPLSNFITFSYPPITPLRTSSYEVNIKGHAYYFFNSIERAGTLQKIHTTEDAKPFTVPITSHNHDLSRNHEVSACQRIETHNTLITLLVPSIPWEA